MNNTQKMHQECELGKLKNKCLLSKREVYFIDSFKYEEIINKRLFNREYRRVRKKTGKEFEELKTWVLDRIHYKNGENFNTTHITYNSMKNNGETHMNNIHNILLEDRLRFENMKKHLEGLEYKIVQEDPEVIERRRKLEKLNNDKNNRL